MRRLRTAPDEGICNLRRYRWQTLRVAGKLNRSQGGEARNPRLRRFLSFSKRVETDQMDGSSDEEVRKRCFGQLKRARATQTEGSDSL